MTYLSKNKTGLVMGGLYGFCHLTWAMMVACKIAEPFLEWLLSLHFLAISYSVNPFQIHQAILLVLFSFTMGYLFGWIFAALWNALNRGT